jgi:hypothetical protein
MIYINFIPTFHFVTALVLFGLLFYFYDPLITWLNTAFPTSGIWSEAMFFFWGVLAAVNLFGSGIRLVLKMQEQ